MAVENQIPATTGDGSAENNEQFPEIFDHDEFDQRDDAPIKYRRVQVDKRTRKERFARRAKIWEESLPTLLNVRAFQSSPESEPAHH
jgi:hypothetical protein